MSIISDSCHVRHRRRARPLISSSKVTFLSIILVSSGVSHCKALELAPQYQNNIMNESIDSNVGNHIDISSDASEYAENDELHRLRGSRKLESAHLMHHLNFATMVNTNNGVPKDINSATGSRKLPIRRGDPPSPPNDNGADTADNDNSNTNNDAATNQNQVTQDGNGSGASAGTSGGGYGDYGSYMNSSPKVSPKEPPPPGVSPTTSTSTAGGGASNYGTSTTTSNSNQGSNTAGSYGSYGSSSYGGSTSGAATSSYGSGSSTSAAYGGSTSSYGSSTYGGSSTSTASTTTKDSYSSAWGATGASGSSSSWGSSTGSSGSSWGTSSFSKLHGPSVQLSIIPVVLLSVLITFIGMLITAHRMENDPEGNFANCCRVLLHTVNCIYKVMYNLYHCRLGDIPQVVFASELEEEEYTDEEIERMRLRPGIERALNVEHRKALRKVGIEMNKIKVTTTKR